MNDNIVSGSWGTPKESISEILAKLRTQPFVVAIQIPDPHEVAYLEKVMEYGRSQERENEDR